MINKAKLYSYFLVIVQFSCITLLIFLNPSMFTKTLPLVIFCLGISLFLYIMYDIKTANFNIIPEIKENAPLITTGVYKYIRHPMYFAVIVTIFSPLSSTLNLTNICIGIVLIFTLFLKAKKEENLWMQESKEYAKYKEKTKMIVPFVL